METSLRHPVQPFAALTRRHFAARGPAVLARCRRMLQQEREREDHAAAGAAGAAEEGAVGGEGAAGEGEAGWADRSVPERASRGFVKSLERLLPRLDRTIGARALAQ